MEIDNTCTKCFPGNDEIKISYYYHINILNAFFTLKTYLFQIPVAVLLIIFLY